MNIYFVVPLPATPLRCGAPTRPLAAALVPIAAASIVACGGSGAQRSPDALRGVRIAPAIAKPDVRLTTTSGRAFDLRDETAGKVTLVFFGYTHCPDVCPVHMTNLAAVLPKLPDSVRERVRVVFVTTDPERDTPAVLGRWLAGFDRTFVGLRGSDADVERLERALRVAPAVREQRAPGDTAYSVGHAAQAVAFTPDDSARVMYPFGTRQADWANDLPLLVSGAWRGGRGKRQ